MIFFADFNFIEKNLLHPITWCISELLLGFPYAMCTRSRAHNWIYPRLLRLNWAVFNVTPDSDAHDFLLQ